ncbi:hypothetical protein M878_45285 [Streptomyces roseochromogenus subsp. oscitans DS 12.976]|uniref:Uncharacterized protein n=1 Tax=Streptomyces roseochromogenus subsp. oscitans DS 12.976 TaxID=1352936 RepID=V6JF57_STRRC|nr:hypothetical protein M878_45285 [Streptomyces roseochromogenus subsp. oscitans DS 12.976]
MRIVVNSARSAVKDKELAAELPAAMMAQRPSAPPGDTEHERGQRAK